MMQEDAFQGCAIGHLETAMQDLKESHARMLAQCDDNTLAENYSRLNVDQRRVVDNVINSVCNESDPIRLIVSGQGGTGKNRVIYVLSKLVSKRCEGKCSVPVAVCAPTGLAAFNVGGTTVHRVLSLPVEHGNPADYSPLCQDQLTSIRATLKGLKLLIIDEVSMVSSLTLLFIHLRLTEILNSNELFGGINIVFFADNNNQLICCNCHRLKAISRLFQ